MQRQEALQRLCDAVEAVVVVGGTSSANTRRLYERALDCGAAAWHISGADELPEAVFRCHRVGLTAGASTPDWIIDEVSEALRRHADAQ
jgi:4-hydroxy-3-methylbut-2-enyl diphosphate reductase